MKKAINLLKLLWISLLSFWYFISTPLTIILTIFLFVGLGRNYCRTSIILISISIFTLFILNYVWAKYYIKHEIKGNSKIHKNIEASVILIMLFTSLTTSLSIIIYFISSIWFIQNIIITIAFSAIATTFFLKKTGLAKIFPEYPRQEVIKGFKVVLNILLIIILSLLVLAFIANYESVITQFFEIADIDKAGNKINKVNKYGEFLKVLLTFIVAVGGFYALMLNNRRVRAIEKSNVDTRYNSAVKLISNTNPTVVIGGIHTLHQIARDNENYIQVVHDLFCSYLRENSEKLYTKNVFKQEVGFKRKEKQSRFPWNNKNIEREIKCPVIIQTLVDYLFKPDSSGFYIYKGMSANLSGACFINCKFNSIDIIEANFSGSKISASYFFDSKISASNFFGSKISASNFFGSTISASNFFGSTISASDFFGSKISASDFSFSTISASNFSFSTISASDFREAEISEELKKIIEGGENNKLEYEEEE